VSVCLNHALQTRREYCTVVARFFFGAMYSAVVILHDGFVDGVMFGQPYCGVTLYRMHSTCPVRLPVAFCMPAAWYYVVVRLCHVIRRWAPRLDESFVQGVSGEYASLRSCWSSHYCAIYMGCYSVCAAASHDIPQHAAQTSSV